MNLDAKLFLFLNSFSGHGRASDIFLVFMAEYLPILLVGAFIVFLAFRNGERRMKIATLITAFIAGFVSRYGIGSPIRYLWHRDRPFLTYPEAHHLILENSYSFPSGHATFLFGFSTVVYCYHKQLGKLFFALSLFIIIARVIVGVHYPSDVFAGAVIGIIIGLFSVKYITPFLLKINNHHAK